MILAAPAYDAYRAIEDYARHPGDIKSQLRFLLLLEEVRKDVVWRSAGPGGEVERIERLVGLRLNTAPTAQKTTVGDQFDVAGMSQHDLKEFYDQAISAYNHSIDPDASDEGSDSGDTMNES